MLESLWMDPEKRYILKRKIKARLQSLLFYLFRALPVRKNRIVFCCIEGTTGYTCNPKYIAEELIARGVDYDLVWLVDDVSKSFPGRIRVVKNTLWNRARELTTARVWIDNSRKQLETRKRKNQIYIQTWHAKLGFKPTCLDRGAAFSEIARLVSGHDSSMIDVVLSNSDWYDATLPTGMMYRGEVWRTGSPRCDILVKGRERARLAVREKFGLPQSAQILMYAPTFRGGSEGIARKVRMDEAAFDYAGLLVALESRFGGKWHIFLRQHPQVVARNLDQAPALERVIDVSRVDDMYELLAGSDAFLTDYSSAAFDAAVTRMPVFLYARDCDSFQKERGRLLWDMEDLPFPFAKSPQELQKNIMGFDGREYGKKLDLLFAETGMVEDGHAAARVADRLQDLFLADNIL